MIYRLLFVVIALVALSRVSSQEADDKEQRTIQLTREMVEGLLQVLSPPCKTEMEAALGSQTEITDECKYEIQSTLAAMQNPNGQASPDANHADQTQPPAEPAKKKEPRAKRQRTPPASASAPTSSVSPVLSIVGFVVVFFALVGALVVYVNKQKASVPVVKPKPLSKKKVRS